MISQVKRAVHTVIEPIMMPKMAEPASSSPTVVPIVPSTSATAIGTMCTCRTASYPLGRGRQKSSLGK